MVFSITKAFFTSFSFLLLGSGSVYAGCLYDYFIKDLKKAYYKKIKKNKCGPQEIKN